MVDFFFVVLTKKVTIYFSCLLVGKLESNAQTYMCQILNTIFSLKLEIIDKDKKMLLYLYISFTIPFPYTYYTVIYITHVFRASLLFISPFASLLRPPRTCSILVSLWPLYSMLCLQSNWYRYPIFFAVFSFYLLWDEAKGAK